MASTILSDNGVSSGSAGLKTTADSTGALALQTTTAGGSATTALTIDASQNVGIGTSSPSTTLTVDNKGGGSTATSGGIRVTQTGWTGSYGYLEFDTVNTVFKLGATSLSFPLSFQTNSLERMRIDTSGNLLFNSGYGSVATAYGCRAWVLFNGASTPTIYASGNVSSITYNGTTAWTVNFTNAMPDVNYSATATCGGLNSGTATAQYMFIQDNVTVQTVSAIRFASSGSLNPQRIAVQIFR